MVGRLTMLEPHRQTDIAALVPYFRDRVVLVLRDLVAAGWDPRVFEAYRSVERQKWLYAAGRTRDTGHPPVTWTRHSRHQVGKAVDIISRSQGWRSQRFFDALKTAARKHQLHLLDADRCHIEWRGGQT